MSGGSLGNDLRAVAIPRPREQVSRHDRQPDANGDGLIGMPMNDLACGLGAMNGLVADAVNGPSAAIEHGGESRAGLGHSGFGQVGGGGHQSARLLGQFVRVMVCWCGECVHRFFQVFDDLEVEASTLGVPEAGREAVRADHPP